MKPRADTVINDFFPGSLHYFTLKTEVIIVTTLDVIPGTTAIFVEYITELNEILEDEHVTCCTKSQTSCLILMHILTCKPLSHFQFRKKINVRGKVLQCIDYPSASDISFVCAKRSGVVVAGETIQTQVFLLEV